MTMSVVSDEQNLRAERRNRAKSPNLAFVAKDIIKSLVSLVLPILHWVPVGFGVIILAFSGKLIAKESK
jgi:hypothetical protein